MDRKHPLAHCEECPLREVGRYVPSIGPQETKLAFVGEAPGVQEARNGIPFSGPSGQLLDTVLRHHNIKREEVFLSNACLCRPPDNATPPKSAIEACRPRLVAELESHNVDTAILLGNSAAESLLRKTGVTKLRVGPGKTGIVPGVRFIPTLHPAAALRQADLFPYIVTDIGKIGLTHELWTKPTVTVADTELDALGFLEQLSKRSSDFQADPSNQGRAAKLVIDIEVDVEKDIAFDHPNQYGMLCVGIGYAKGKVLVLGENAMASQQVRDRLGVLLRSVLIGGQNLKFDLAGLYGLLGALEGWFDTMLASYVFDERPGVHSLDYQGIEYLGTPDWKRELDKYKQTGQGYGVIPRHILYAYNGNDVSVTWDLIEMYEKMFEGHEDLRRVHDFLMKASNQLMYLELNGIKPDLDYLKELEIEFLERLATIRGEVNEIIGDRDYEPKSSRSVGLNPNSPQQVTKYLLDMGVKVDTTDADTLEMMIERLQGPKFKDDIGLQEVVKFCQILLRHRKEAKLYGTYVKGIRKRLYRGRVYPTFMLHGTTTGRLSCRNPNLQNIPRESSIRRLFVPSKPENVFVQTDYSQAELRVLCYLAKDIYFRDIFNEGIRDIFDELTPIVFPRAGSKREVAPAAWKELRVRVKAFVYGLAYGRTPEGLALEYGFTMREAYEARDNFFAAIPEIVSFLARIRTDVRAGLDLVTPWGRHRRFMLITKENVKDIMNQAQAFLPQSTASDMCLDAMVNVRKDTRGFAWIRNIVHDSILTECHPDDVEEVKEIQERRMIESFDLICGGYVKGAVESKVGKHWGEV